QQGMGAGIERVTLHTETGDRNRVRRVAGSDALVRRLYFGRRARVGRGAAALEPDARGVGAAEAQLHPRQPVCGAVRGGARVIEAIDVAGRRGSIGQDQAEGEALERVRALDLVEGALARLEEEHRAALRVFEPEVREVIRAEARVAIGPAHQWSVGG